MKLLLLFAKIFVCILSYNKIEKKRIKNLFSSVMHLLSFQI